MGMPVGILLIIILTVETTQSSVGSTTPQEKDHDLFMSGVIELT